MWGVHEPLAHMSIYIGAPSGRLEAVPGAAWVIVPRRDVDGQQPMLADVLTQKQRKVVYVAYNFWLDLAPIDDEELLTVEAGDRELAGVGDGKRIGGGVVNWAVSLGRLVGLIAVKAGFSTKPQILIFP